METWKKVVGYEGYYEVSNIGNIRHVIYGLKKLNTRDKDGYIHIKLKKEGVASIKIVHRLVAIAFIPNPENKRTVNHINGIKEDNRVENLEWATDKENTIHSWKLGLSKPYIRKPRI